MGSLAIAVDFGGSKIIAGLVDRKGNTLARHRVPSSSDIDEAVAAIFSLIERLLSAGKTKHRRITGIGVSVPGMADGRSGILLYAPFYDLRNLPLAGIIEDKFGIKARIENDVNACALAELHFGHGRQVKNFLWITVSNGIGGALVVNGRLCRGANNLAGEIGHITVKNGGRVCDCGRRGCLEAVASGRAIQKNAVSRIRRGGRSLIPGLTGGEYGRLTTRVICEAARKGDALAREVLLETAEYLARAVSIAVNIIDPQMVILGGGVSQAGTLLLDPLRRRVRDYTIMGTSRSVPIVRTRLGYHASFIGAATLVFCKTEMR